MKIALFGGTFDPIHAGHLRAARAAAKSFKLDRVLFMPSGNPPHKRKGPL
ncbi:MAG TPA: adenylyltransferase/cytidyltransferase family protein, partial [Terriglobia bacterium]|nr:adenylyltransferase/cytidyltransferase family protein [Terriglobia bacterium]